MIALLVLAELLDVPKTWPERIGVIVFTVTVLGLGALRTRQQARIAKRTAEIERHVGKSNGSGPVAEMVERIEKALGRLTDTVDRMDARGVLHEQADDRRFAGLSEALHEQSNRIDHIERSM